MQVSVLMMLESIAAVMLLFCESHADMALHITTKVKAVMFNLGYLPGGDKKIITQAHSTVAALSAAIDVVVLWRDINGDVLSGS